MRPFGAEPTAVIDLLAEEIHEVFRDTLRVQGRLLPEHDMPYARLPNGPEKDMTRALARWHLQRTGRLR